MNMKQLDKKQIPQFAALCVLSAGLFGYLVIHLVAPGPASAGTRGPAAAGTAGPAAAVASTGPAAAGTAAQSGGITAPDAANADAPPPSPAMHDPFAVGYVDPGTVLPVAGLPGVQAPALPKLPPAGKQVAALGPMPVSLLPEGPAAPALPAAPPLPAPLGSAAAPALPAPPAAPLWTVTGVLQGPTGKVAILRDGDARRIVRSGDFVDGTYRVTGVSRTSVTLRHGAAVYQIVLGADKSAPAKPGTAGAAPSSPALALPAIALPSAPAPRSAAALDSAITPVYRLPRTSLPLAHLKRQGSALALTAQALTVPKPAKSVSPAKVASAISLGLRLLDGSVLAQSRHQGHKE